MSLVSSAFRFVFSHAFASAARMAATATPEAAATGIDIIKNTPMPETGSPNSTAGVASGVVGQLENDLNEAVMAFVKATVDQLPVVGGIANVTGLDQDAANAAKALLVMGEQHALTYLSALFSGHHLAVNSVTVQTTGQFNSPLPKAQRRPRIEPWRHLIHRGRRVDFRGRATMAVLPWLGVLP